MNKRQVEKLQAVLAASGMKAVEVAAVIEGMKPQPRDVRLYTVSLKDAQVAELRETHPDIVFKLSNPRSKTILQYARQKAKRAGLVKGSEKYDAYVIKAVTVACARENVAVDTVLPIKLLRKV